MDRNRIVTPYLRRFQHRRRRVTSIDEAIGNDQAGYLLLGDSQPASLKLASPCR
jgi:hypothetical protein